MSTLHDYAPRIEQRERNSMRIRHALHHIGMLVVIIYILSPLLR
jgi:hypothetical protein